jgi:hypothetical protein
MACKSCERRRREMAIYAEALKEWAGKPFGPSLHVIHTRLLAAARARGEFADLEKTDD